MGACCCKETEQPPSLPQGGPTTSVVLNTTSNEPFPDTFRAPPPPIPYDVVRGRPVSPPATQEMGDEKSGDDAVARATNPVSVQEAGGDDVQDPSAKSEDVKESEDSEEQAEAEVAVERERAVEVPRPAESSAAAVAVAVEVEVEVEEDGCPICFEDYDTQDPKITLRCTHHFHMACLMNWMERSQICPVCDQAVNINDER